MIQLTEKYFAIEVPGDAERPHIMRFSNPETFAYDYSIERGGKMTKRLIAMIDLPPGSWEYICASTEIIEEQAKEIVEKEGALYVDYQLFRSHLQNYCDTALESFHSLLRSKSLGRVAIIKKVI